MTTTKSYDYLNRLASTANVDSNLAPLTSHFYQYNDANQRTRVNLEDGSYWIYEYDYYGQLTSGKRYWSDGTPVAGQQFEYAFDEIGNRKLARAGGDAAGASLRLANYTNNMLNQITGRDVPGAADIVGIAHAHATVTVNNQSPYRKGEYYWKELTIANTGGPMWTNVTNIASLSGTSQTNIGNVFLPKTAEKFTYDADGNLTSDGRWTNRWDAENRLIEMEALSGGPAGASNKLRFVYDDRSRRVGKTVLKPVSGSYQLSSSNFFVYDGWNLVAEVNKTNKAPIRSFIWGTDLSGSPQGAGGVGGLIALSTFDTQPSTLFAAYDGNGNVAALVDGKTGSASARYEQGPFAEGIRESGAAASVNPVRFSSKYQDKETDQFYYGYRFYNPSQGRWLNRDPLGERGGVNLSFFSKNNSINRIDIHGLFCEDPCKTWRIEDMVSGRWEHERMYGAIMCCGAKQFVCVWDSTIERNYSAPARGIVERCVREHEEAHLTDGTKCQPSCMPYIREYSSTQERDEKECSAYKVEKDCLEKSRGECEDGDSACHEQLNQRMGTVVENINSRCRE